MRRLLVLAVIACASCALFHDTVKPTAYGSELAACTEQAHNWEEYAPCCIDVARRYGRDFRFCFQDGGQ